MQMPQPDPNVIVSAFTEEQTAKLTGCSPRQLRYWDRSGFYQPEFADPDRRTAYSRIYSFRDLLSLQILNTLRNDLGVSLQHLRAVKEGLAHLGEDKWSKTRLQVVKREVVFHDDDADESRGAISGQIVLQPIVLETVRAKMATAVRAMKQRDETAVGRIERSRFIAGNQAVLAGTRIPVRSIKAFVKEGYTADEIRKEYPSLTDADIAAAEAYEDAA